MNIVFPLSYNPRSFCGVGDYTEKLAKALVTLGVSVDIDRKTNWSIRRLGSLRRVFQASDSIVHLQYPTLNMGQSLTPAMLALVCPKSRLFTTFHEFHVFHPLRRLAFLSQAIVGSNLIFTSEDERGHFQRFLPIYRGTATIIPIGNNVPGAGQPKQKRDRMIYFGQIREKKGIEDFINTVCLLRAQNNNVPCAIIGALGEADAPIAKLIRAMAATLDIVLKFNLPPEKVADELADSNIALLPFPDGISEKRGSAIACLEHGLTVISKHSNRTPVWLAETTYSMTQPADAVSTINALLNGSYPACPAPEILSTELAKRKWPNIAKQHLDLYEVSLRKADVQLGFRTPSQAILQELSKDVRRISTLGRKIKLRP
jgi:glycosyltransferase involved in cell wall biosynthesis